MKNCHLETLMKKLGLTEKALADKINVDKTLINKWKNGKRTLDVASPHFGNVVAAIDEVSKSKTPNVLERFFKDFLADAPLRDKIAEYLSTSCDDDIFDASEDGKEIQITTFSGCDERPEAFKYYYSESANVKSDEMFLLQSQDFECSALFDACNANFLDFLKTSLGNSNTVNLLYLCFDAKGFREHFIEICPLALNENLNISVKFLPMSQSKFRLASFTSGKKLCLIAQTITQKPAQMIFTIIKDEALCNFETKRWKIEASDSVPFCKSYALNSAGRIFQDIADIPESPSPTIVYCACPTFFCMSERLLRKIFGYNKLTKSKTDNSITFYNSVKNIYLKNLEYKSVKEVYDLNSISALLATPAFYHPFLSLAAQQSITVPRSLYLEYFTEMLDFFSSGENTEISLVSTPFKGVDNNFIYIIKQYNYAFAGTTSFIKNNLLFTRMVQSVELIYSAFEEQYNEIPDFVKSKQTIIAHLKRTIETLSKDN